MAWQDPSKDLVGMSLILSVPSIMLGNPWIACLGVPAWMGLRYLYHELEFYADLRDDKERGRDEAVRARFDYEAKLQQRKLELYDCYEQGRLEWYVRLRRLKDQ